MQKDDSPVSEERRPQLKRLDVRYSRAELLHLSKSPLVAPPEGMPDLSDWFGQFEHTSPVMNKREAKDLNTGEVGSGRERRYRKEDEESGSRSYRPNLSQGGPMGSFRLQPVRTESDRLRNTDNYDKDRSAGLAGSSLALRRDRERDRDTAPHLAKREVGAAPLRGSERPRDLKDRDPGRETAADRAADRERAREAGRRRKEEELSGEAPKKERGRAGESQDWRTKDAEGAVRRDDRDADREKDRERERERDAEYMRKYGDSWVPEPDRYDRDRRARDRERDRDWERDRDRERDRSRERSEYPPRSSAGRTPWDTEKERASYDRRRRDEREDLRRSDKDRERDRDRRPPSPEPLRRRRSRSRQRSPSPIGDRRRRPGARDEVEEKEPAWATDDVAPVGGLRGLLGSGEDKLQAWKRQMKEAEEKKKEAARTPEVIDDRDSGEEKKDAAPPPGLEAAAPAEPAQNKPIPAAEPPLPLHLRLAGKSAHAFKGIGQAAPSTPTSTAQSVADKLAEIVSAPNYGQNALITPQPSQDTISPTPSSEGRQMSVSEFFGVGQNGGLTDAAKKAAELNRPISSTATAPPPMTLLPSPTPTLPPTTGPIMSSSNMSNDGAPRGSRFAKLWDNRAPASGSMDMSLQSRMDETASLGGMLQGMALGGPTPSTVSQNNEQQRMNELLSTLRGAPTASLPSQARTSPMNVFPSGAGQGNVAQQHIPTQTPFGGPYIGQHEGYPSDRLGGLSRGPQPATHPQHQYQQLYEYKQQQRAQQLRQIEAARERELALQQAEREQMERLQLAAQRERHLQEIQLEMRMRAQYQGSADFERDQQRREQARQYYEYQQRLMQQQSQQQVQIQQQQHLLSQQQQQQQQQQSQQEQSLLSQFQQPQGLFGSNAQMDSNPYDRTVVRSGDGQRDRSLTRHSQYEHLPTPPASLPQRPPGMASQPFNGSVPAPPKPVTPGGMFSEQTLPSQSSLPMRPQQGLVSPQSQYPPNLPMQQSAAQFNSFPNASVLGHSRSGTSTSMSGFPSSGSGINAGGVTYQQQQQLQAQQQQRQTQQQLLLSQFQGGIRGGYGNPQGAPLTTPSIQQHGQPINGPSPGPGGQQLPPHMLSGRLPPQF